MKSGKFKIHNVNDTAEIAIRQFEDYGYDISEKGKTIVYRNMTAGGHDDAVSASYFAVADIVVNEVEEAANFYSEDNFVLLNNSFSKKNDIKGGFY